MHASYPGIEGTYELYTAALKAIFGPGVEQQSLINLCSHISRMTALHPFREKVHVDVVDVSDQMLDTGTFVCCDVLGSHPCFERTYDVALCADGIEHLTDDQGEKLLLRMRDLAPLRVIFTPMNFFGGGLDASDPFTHKSLWVPSDLPGWASLEFPDYHRSHYSAGAWFGWRRDGIMLEDFDRVRFEFETWLQGGSR